MRIERLTQWIERLTMRIERLTSRIERVTAELSAFAHAVVSRRMLLTFQ